jgi:hypothetical protein
MNCISYVPCVALIGSLLIGVPQGFAQNAESSPSEPLRLSVAPHTSSQIAMKTLPKATCVLHAQGDSDASHSFKVFADDEGMIRFHVNPSEESDQVAVFAVDCTAAGQSSTFGLELRSNAIPRLDMPAPAAEMRASQASDVIRPALTKAEALHLSGDEIVKRGYPVRPNAKEAPAAFATWLKAVTKPSRLVDARQVARPEIRHVNPVSNSNRENSGNWSGFELRGASGTYDLVEGEWYVPRVYYETNRHTYSSFWIGLDGDGTNDLWQAGTEQEIQDIVIFGIHFDFTSYYAWTEFLPPQGTESVLGNFTVAPGDLMFSEVWVGNYGQSPSLSGSYAIAFVENISRGEYTTVYNCRGVSFFGICTNISQVNIGGSEAEWIMERPTVNGSLPDLSDYSYTFMYDAYALKTNGYWMNYNGANNQQIFMYNGNDLLSAAYPWTGSTILFEWYNFH